MRTFYSTCFLMWDAPVRNKDCLTVLSTAQILIGSVASLKMLGLPVKVCTENAKINAGSVHWEHCRQSFSKPNISFSSFLAITTPYANCTDGQLRLVGGANIREGRVEICINNAWGTICDDELFGTQDAIVVCTQMGFSNRGTFSFGLIYRFYVTVL